MSKFNKVLFATVFSLWFLILVVTISNRYDCAKERRMYERGAYQTEAYHRCMGKYPSVAFRDEMWNLVNMPEDCTYIKAADETIVNKYERIAKEKK